MLSLVPSSATSVETNMQPSGGSAGRQRTHMPTLLYHAAPSRGHDGEVRQVNLRNEWSVDSWTAGDSCAEGCAQLDDFNWFLPADDRVGDLPAPESQVDLSDSESDVDDVEPDSALMQIRMTAVESLCPGKPVFWPLLAPFHIFIAPCSFIGVMS